MNFTIFDIETIALPLAQIRSFLPECKLGNTKDPAKVAARLAEHEQECLEGAALDPLLSKVVAIGFSTESGPEVLWFEDEVTLLDGIWSHFEARHKSDYFIGFNSKNFDLPFLIKRSWIQGVKVPSWLRKDRYWSGQFIDLQEVWQCGDWKARGKLGQICAAMGLGVKSGNGAEFAKLWEENREQALEYIKHDVRLTESLAKRLGVVP